MVTLCVLKNFLVKEVEPPPLKETTKKTLVSFMLILSFDLVKSLVYMYSVYVCNSKLNPAVNMVNVPQLPACCFSLVTKKYIQILDNPCKTSCVFFLLKNFASSKGVIYRKMKMKHLLAERPSFLKNHVIAHCLCEVS